MNLKRWIWIVFHPRATAALLDDREQMVKDIAERHAKLQQWIKLNLDSCNQNNLYARVLKAAQKIYGTHVGDFNFSVDPKDEPYVTRPPKS